MLVDVLRLGLLVDGLRLGLLVDGMMDGWSVEGLRLGSSVEGLMDGSSVEGLMVGMTVGLTDGGKVHTKVPATSPPMTPFPYMSTRPICGIDSKRQTISPCEYSYRGFNSNRNLNRDKIKRKHRTEVKF